MKCIRLLFALLLSSVLFLNVFSMGFASIILKIDGGDASYFVDSSTSLSSGSDANNSVLGQLGASGIDSAFSDPYGLSSLDRTKRLEDLKKIADPAWLDNDSAHLVVGLSAGRSSYAGIADIVVSSLGKICNKVSLNAIPIAVAVDLPLDSVFEFARRVRTSTWTRYIEPRVKYHTAFVPNDPNWSVQWGPRKIAADWAWNVTLGDHGILVAVVDTGVDYTHPDLSSNYVPLGYDWTNGDSDPIDDCGHGTHCAGIIAAQIDNGIGVAGLSQVQLMAEKVLDASGIGYDSWVAEGIIHATDAGANIVSLSLGGPADSQLMHDAVKYAYSKGVLVVAAAGNDGSSLESYPAAYSEVVAVAATDGGDSPAFFTNHGEWVELAAPGVDIYSTMPTYHVTLNDAGLPENYATLSGTSMACPHVSGLAALIWSHYKFATNEWIRTKMRVSTDDLGETGFDEYYGFGRVNARTALETLSDHDLAISSFEQAHRIVPGDRVCVNGTVMNLGVNDEYNVTLQILVNGTVMDSETLDLIRTGESADVSLFWSISTEGLFNVTLYAIPVSGETSTADNAMTKITVVKNPLGRVLLDLTRADPWISYRKWIQRLEINGFWIDTCSEGFITAILLENYDILVRGGGSFTDYTEHEEADIRDFVLDGGGLLALDYTGDLLDFAGISTVREQYGWSGVGRVVADHEITNGIRLVMLLPYLKYNVESPATALVQDSDLLNESFVVASQAGAGKIAASDSFPISDNALDVMDNALLGDNMVEWLVRTNREHELAVNLDYPSDAEPYENLILNASVINRGSNNETDINVRFQVNDTVVTELTIPKLESSETFRLSIPILFPSAAVYNCTLSATSAANEEIMTNNREIDFIKVHDPLITPSEGQYANYAEYFYDPSGKLIRIQSFNITYDQYVAPHRIRVTAHFEPTENSVASYWMIVDTMDRLVVDGEFTYSYFGFWIENELNIGSEIKFDLRNLVIDSSKIVQTENRSFDCWRISLRQPIWYETYDFDKSSGLVATYFEVDYSSASTRISLKETNIELSSPPEHDLGASLHVESRIEPNMSSTIKASLFNLGISDERNVKLTILIDGNIVIEDVADSLLAGSVHELNYDWTPTMKGIYCVSARVEPAGNDSCSLNDADSSYVYVYQKEVALIDDYTTFDDVAPILDSVGIGYDKLHNNFVEHFTENLTLLLNYEVVILWVNNERLTAKEYDALDAYLCSGGNLLVGGRLAYDLYLARLVRSSTYAWANPDFYFTIANESHPIVNGPYGSFERGQTVGPVYGAYCSHARADNSRNAVSVAELEVNYNDEIIATEGLPGKVVFWNGMEHFNWMFDKSCRIMLENLLYWFTATHELAVSLQAPKLLVVNTSTVLRASVRDIGSMNCDAAIQLLINDEIVKSENIANLRTQASYTVNYVWTPKVTGEYNVTVYAPPIPEEGFAGNNLCSKTVSVEWAPHVLAYVANSSTADYANIRRAINLMSSAVAVFTEFSNPTELGSLIQGNDVLLVPEQEFSTFEEMFVMGSNWSSVLTSFLEDGGVVVVCDFMDGTGGTYGVLTGSDLMYVSGCVDTSFFPLHVAGSDYAAKGVSSSFVAPAGTVGFLTSERGAVIDGGGRPVVIHKRTGLGHVVLLGFDFSELSNENMRIMGNCINLAFPISVFVSPDFGEVGDGIHVSGKNATEEQIVSISWDNDPIGNVTANSSGCFNYVFAIPFDACFGFHTLGVVDLVRGRLASLSVRVIPHDVRLAIMKVSLSRSVAALNSSVRVAVGLEYVGRDTSSVELNILANGTRIVSENVSLDMVDSRTVVFTWNTAGFAKGNYEVVAEVAALPGEPDISDNTLSGDMLVLSVLGDLTGLSIGVPDGFVNMYDASFVCRGFGACSGDSRWNPNMDLNDDGRIDLRDIGIVCANYGNR